MKQRARKIVSALLAAAMFTSSAVPSAAESLVGIDGVDTQTEAATDAALVDVTEAETEAAEKQETENITEAVTESETTEVPVTEAVTENTEPTNTETEITEQATEAPAETAAQQDTEAATEGTEEPAEEEKAEKDALREQVDVSVHIREKKGVFDAINLDGAEIATIKVDAVNSMGDEIALKLYFWEYDGDLPQKEEKWKDILDVPCMDARLSAEDGTENITVELRTADGSASQAVREVKDAENGIHYAVAEIPSEAEAHMVFQVSSEKTESLVIAAAVSDGEEEAYLDSVSIVWAKSEEEAETEHFLGVSEGTDALDKAAFSSMRLVVMADEESDIIDPEHILSAYDHIYLLEYGTVQQTMNAYLYYMGNASAVEPDATVNMASEGKAGDSQPSQGANAADPVAALSESIAIPEAGTNGVIALIDTGVAEGNNVIGRISLIDEQLSGNGHGDDMVAAITSVNPGAKILSIRALGNNGQGTISSVVSAIEYAIEQDVSVINLSLYAKASLLNSVLKKEIQKAAGLGIIVVGAAGNNSEDASKYMPGAVAEAYIIGACDENGTRLPNSNYGATVDYNVVSESTSEAAAKFSGYVSLYGTGSLNPESSNGLVYVPSDVLEEETESGSEMEEETETGTEDNAHKHRIFISNAENYTISVPIGVYEYSAGEEVTFIAEPEEGFELGKAYYMQCGAIYLPDGENTDVEETDKEDNGSAQAGEFLDKSSKGSPDSLILYDETQKEAEETYSGTELAGTSNVLDSKEFTFIMPDTDVILFCDGAESLYTAATTVDSVKLVNSTTFWKCPTAYQSSTATSAGGIGTIVRHVEITQSNGNKKTVAAYCLQPALGGPSGGNKDFEEISNRTKVAKLLYYAEYGGITWGEDAYYMENGKKKTINFKDWFKGKGITSEGNCRFILHLALAKAYGVDDWNCGTGTTGSHFGLTVKPALNSKGIALVEELIGYIEKLDTPGSSFSSTSVTASYNTSTGKSVSESVTFKGDYGNTATISLPAGISLVNETTGKTSTGTAVVNGKDKFHLEADSTIAGSGTYSFETKFAINFEAYKIKQSGVQNIGFMWRGTTKKLTLKVEWPEASKPVYVKVQKTSTAGAEILGLSSYSIEGAQFGVYSDVTCKTKLATLTTNASGTTSTYELPCKANGTYTYYVREDVAPAGHAQNATAYRLTVTLPADANTTKTVTVSDDPVFPTVDAIVQKLGRSDNKIEGAEFEVKFYDGNSASAGQLKKTWYLKSDEAGLVYLDKNYCVEGKGDSFYTWNGNVVIPKGYLTIQETKAPTGFILDDTVHAWNTAGQTIELKKIYNDPKSGKITIRKLDSDGKTPLEGVTFKLEFVKERYDSTNATSPIKRLLKVGESIEYMTDSKGMVIFDNLELGDYIITETKTTPGHTLLAEPIKISLPLTMTKAEVEAAGNVDLSKATLNEADNTYFFFEATYDVTNNASFKMPTSGAAGNWFAGYAGIVILAVMLFIWMNEKRCKKA